MKVPNCPFCDDDTTLEPTRAEPRGVKVCVCGQCGKRVRVNADGHIIAVVEAAIEFAQGQA